MIKVQRGDLMLQLPQSSVLRIFVPKQVLRPPGTEVCFATLDGQPALLAEPQQLVERISRIDSGGDTVEFPPAPTTAPKVAVAIGTLEGYCVAMAADAVELSSSDEPMHFRLRPIHMMEAEL